MKVVLFCGDSASACASLRPAPQADGADRRPTHPVARDEVLRALRLQGLHPAAWATAEAIKDYFLTYTRRSPTTSCCRRRREGASGKRHPQLVHHLRQHRPQRRHRRAPAHGAGPLRATRSSSPTTATRSPTPRSPAMVVAARTNGARPASSALTEVQFPRVVSRATRGASTIHDVTRIGRRINGGFFLLRRAIFDDLREGEDLVEEPYRRLIAVTACSPPYDGFWAPIDTLKDQQRLSLRRRPGAVAGTPPARPDRRSRRDGWLMLPPLPAGRAPSGRRRRHRLRRWTTVRTAGRVRVSSGPAHRQRALRRGTPGSCFQENKFSEGGERIRYLGDVPGRRRRPQIPDGLHNVTTRRWGSEVVSRN